MATKKKQAPNNFHRNKKKAIKNVRLKRTSPNFPRVPPGFTAAETALGNALTVEAETKPIETLSKCRDMMDAAVKSHRKQLHILLCVVFAVGLKLSKTPKHWQAFIKLAESSPLKHKPGPFKIDEVIPWVCKYYLSDGTQNGSKRASKASIVFRRYATENKSADDLMKDLKKDGGLSGLAESLSKSRAKESSEQPASRQIEDERDDSETAASKPQKDRSDGTQEEKRAGIGHNSRGAQDAIASLPEEFKKSERKIGEIAGKSLEISRKVKLKIEKMSIGDEISCTLIRREYEEGYLLKLK